MALVKEILLEPRWDTAEFNLAKTRTSNRILQAAAQPARVTNLAFSRLIYGPDHIFGFNPDGTKESIERITIDDLKSWYSNNISPTLSRIHVAGNVSREEVVTALKPLENEWKAKEINLRAYPHPEIPVKSQVFFVDIPGSRQSVINIGYPALSRDNPDYVKADFINYRLGGAFSSILMQILREEKGIHIRCQKFFPGDEVDSAVRGISECQVGCNT